MDFGGFELLELGMEAFAAETHQFSALQDGAVQQAIQDPSFQHQMDQGHVEQAKQQLGDALSEIYEDEDEAQAKAEEAVEEIQRAEEKLQF